jgi:hypothetical protein
MNNPNSIMLKIFGIYQVEYEEKNAKAKKGGE